MRAPSSPNRATSAEAASSATWPIRRRPKRRSRARMSGVGGQQEAGSGARKRGLGAGRDRDEAAGLGGERRHGGREARAGDPRAEARPASERLERVADPRDQARLGAPQGLEPVDLGLEQPERDARPDRTSRRAPG